jgi:hypothetical protein
MPLKVVSLSTYRTSKGTGWSKADYNASRFVKAIKEKPVKGYGYVPVGGGKVLLLDASTAKDAPAMFAQRAAIVVKWDQVGPVAFVPLPNSSCAVNTDQPPRTRKLADALATHILTGDAIVADILRWDTPLPSAHEAGGTRDPQLLYPRLRLVGDVPAGRRIVLIDDVLTSGGHLRAAAAFLEAQGATVAGAVCAGRADDGLTVTNAFAPRTDTLESFVYDAETGNLF